MWWLQCLYCRKRSADVYLVPYHGHYHGRCWAKLSRERAAMLRRWRKRDAPRRSGESSGNPV